MNKSESMRRMHGSIAVIVHKIKVAIIKNSLKFVSVIFVGQSLKENFKIITLNANLFHLIMKVQLKERFIFGVDLPFVGNPISFLDELTAVYIAGGSVIVQNIITKEQRFVHARSNFQILGAIASSSILVVFEEQAQHSFQPFISIFNSSIECGPTKTVQVEIDSDFASTSIVNRQKQLPLCIQRGGSLIALVINTNCDQCQLLCLSSDGDILVNERLDREVSNTSKLNLSFHSHANLICVQSENKFWLYRIMEDKGNWVARLINFPYENVAWDKNNKLTCHSWIIDSDSILVLGKDSGDVLITDHGKLIRSIQVGYKIVSLLGTSSGFIIGGTDTRCCIYSIDASNNEFHRKSEFKVKSSMMKKCIDINSIAISDSLSYMCVFLSGVNEVYMNDLHDGLNAEEGWIQLACAHSNVDLITSCSQKSIILTAGSDNTVRCWDYVSGEQRLCKQFSETATSISLHPSGLHALISFPDYVNCVHLLNDEFRTFWDIRLPRKTCSACLISKGGHKFAVAYDNIIQIYDFYTGKLSHELRGHNRRISRIYWINRDTEIISVGEDGIIYRFDIFTSHIASECVRYKAKSDFECMLISKEAIWVCSEEVIQILSPLDFEVMEEVKFKQQNFNRRTLTTIVANDDLSTVLLGMKSMRMLLCSFPFGGFIEVPFHTAIDAMHIYEDIVFIKVLSSLCVLELLNEPTKDTLLTQFAQSPIDMFSWRNHCLISEVHIEEKKTIFDDLVSMTLELKSTHEYKCTMLNMKNYEELCDLEDRYNTLLCNHQSESKRGIETGKRLTRHNETILRNQSKSYQERLLQMANEHSSNLLKIFEQNRVERGRIEKRIEELVASIKVMSDNYEMALSHKKEYFTNILMDKEKMTSTLKHELNSHQLEFVETLEQVEDEIDTHLNSHKSNCAQLLSSERQSTLKANSENGILFKRTNALIQSIEEQKERIKLLLYKEEVESEKLKMTKQRLSVLYTTIRKKNVVLSSKKKTNSRFKTRQEELTKLSIFNEKIDELNKHVSNDAIVLSAKEKNSQKEKLLDLFQSEHNDIEKLLAFRKLQIDSKHELLRTQIDKILVIENKLESTKSNICFYLSLIKQPSKLLTSISDIATNISSKPDHKIHEQGQDQNDTRDAGCLDSKLKGLAKALRWQDQRNVQEIESLTHMNQKLLENIRSTREKNRMSLSLMNKVKNNAT